MSKFTTLASQDEVNYTDKTLPPERISVRTRQRIRVDNTNGRLSHTYSHLFTGEKRNRRTFETWRWWRWQTTSGLSIGLTKQNHIHVTSFWVPERTTKPIFHSDSPSDLERFFTEQTINEGPPALVEASYHAFMYEAYRRFGPVTLQRVYPMTEAFPRVNTFDRLPTGLPELKETDPRICVERMFGKTRYRKDLVKAVFATESLHTVAMAKQFKQFVPIDWIINFLRQNAENGALYIREPVQWNLLGKMLPYFTPEEIRRLLRSEITPRDRNGLFDVLNRMRMSIARNELGEIIQHRRDIRHFPRIRNWYDVHELMLGYDLANAMFRGVHHEVMDHEVIDRMQYNMQLGRVSFTETDPVPVTELGQKIFARRMFVAPETPADLYGWGVAMRNCIGSYASDVMQPNSKTVLGKVIDPSKPDKMIANFEVRNGRLQQLLGPCNQSLPVAVRQMCEFEFREAGVEIDEYWGNK